MTELQKFEQHIALLSKNTRKSYLSLYFSLNEKLGKEIHRANTLDLVIAIDDVTENPSTRWSLIYIPIIIYKLYEKPIHVLVDYRNIIFEQKKKHLEQKNIELNGELPPLEDLYEYLEQLYNEKKYEQYIINYLLINFGVRNKDLDCFITNNSKVLDDEFYGELNILLVKGNWVSWIRNNYKTYKTYGQKIISITDIKFYDSVKKLPNNSWLLNNKGTRISESAIGKHIQRRTYQDLSEGEIFKIIVKDITTGGKNVLTKLNEISNSRGTDIKTIKSYYDLDNL
jgi:hypothetical protein